LLQSSAVGCWQFPLVTTAAEDNADDDDDGSSRKDVCDPLLVLQLLLEE